jgi:D-tyrosyl-tRNA(Tyr) deacylase
LIERQLRLPFLLSFLEVIMKAFIQRVSFASVSVVDVSIGAIDGGLLVLLGVGHDDTKEHVDKLLHKLLHYRVFADSDDKMNLNVQQVDGGLLIVSQFTLMADTQKGMRPGFSAAAKPALAEELYDYMLEQAALLYRSDKIQSGQFAADMQVTLLNDGPVTFLLEV